ncbi:hypothetical protein P280DRAFT_231796 [Massarina eburnea CBS 473.64]|uniref:Uncharacterized protein n=1 Tax=Massarina eburnea CBS 473.64 TaxID=1395130 RepID=A0A6A6RJS2_9PLEO|nr:hypothetical protein P280DRAFT_231796 [Massarina eburnea CBS 473.64]
MLATVGLYCEFMEAFHDWAKFAVRALMHRRGKCFPLTIRVFHVYVNDEGNDEAKKAHEKLIEANEKLKDGEADYELPMLLENGGFMAQG